MCIVERVTNPVYFFEESLQQKRLGRVGLGSATETPKDQISDVAPLPQADTIQEAIKQSIEARELQLEEMHNFLNSVFPDTQDIVDQLNIQDSVETIGRVWQGLIDEKEEQDELDLQKLRILLWSFTDWPAGVLAIKLQFSDLQLVAKSRFDFRSYVKRNNISLGQLAIPQPDHDDSRTQGEVNDARPSKRLNIFLNKVYANVDGVEDIVDRLNANQAHKLLHLLNRGVRAFVGNREGEEMVRNINATVKGRGNEFVMPELPEALLADSTSLVQLLDFVMDGRSGLIKEPEKSTQKSRQKAPKTETKRTVSSFAEPKKKPILKADEEVELGKKIEAGLYAEYKLQEEIDDIELRVDLRQIAREGREAKEEFILRNEALVKAIVWRKYFTYIAEGLVRQTDLIQAGMIGLIRTVEKYDFTLGYKFSTYATYRIRQAIQREIQDTCRTIRLPYYIWEEIDGVKRAQRDLLRDLGRTPTDAEVVELRGISIERLRWLQEVKGGVLSLDKPFGDDGSRTLGDTIDAGESTFEDDLVGDMARSQLLETILSVPDLTSREKYIIQVKYFGLEVPSDEEIGRQIVAESDRGYLGRSHVTQMRDSALKKIEKHLGYEELLRLLQ